MCTWSVVGSVKKICFPRTFFCSQWSAKPGSAPGGLCLYPGTRSGLSALGKKSSNTQPRFTEVKRLWDLFSSLKGRKIYTCNVGHDVMNRTNGDNGAHFQTAPYLWSQCLVECVCGKACTPHFIFVYIKTELFMFPGPLPSFKNDTWCKQSSSLTLEMVPQRKSWSRVTFGILATVTSW